MPKVMKEGAQLAWKLSVASRAFLAICGGYGLAALTAASLGAALPGPRIHAMLAATLLGFLVHACFAIWAFCTQTAGRAWAGGLLLAAVPALHLWWTGGAA